MKNKTSYCHTSCAFKVHISHATLPITALVMQNSAYRHAEQRRTVIYVNVFDRNKQNTITFLN